jgi:hypothetical protein
LHVDFFVAGVQKSGSTALDAILRRHPEIEMADRKELHFFDDESLDWATPDYARLHAHFRGAASARVRGEATPIYTYWPNAIERLAAYNRAARLVVGLRHPALRAFSHWRMESSRAAEDLPFPEAIRAGRKRVATVPGGVHRVYSYVERGFYARQIERLLIHFPRDQLYFFRTDELWRAPQRTVSAILSFLGVTDMPLVHGREYIVPQQSKLAEMGRADYEELRTLFKEDIIRTSALTGIELGAWLQDDYEEPMAPTGDERFP